MRAVNILIRSSFCWIGFTSLSFAQGDCLTEGCLPHRHVPNCQCHSLSPSKDNGKNNLADRNPDDQSNAIAPSSNQGPVNFTAPTPSGEVAGARRSFGLPSLHISLPKVSFETPEFKLNGWTQFRRDPHMVLDGGTAPMAQNNPVLFGQLAGATMQQSSQPRNSVAPSKGKDDSQNQTAPSNPPCDSPCVTGEQSEEVRELAKQVQQLQGLLLQLAEQQAGGQQAAAESTETAEEEQPAPEVSYVPRKAKMVSTTRQVKNPTTRESVAAAKRLQQLQEILDEKQAEMEALQAEQEEVEAAEREEIEAEERRLAARKKQLEEERVSRLRNRMARESTTEEPVARKVSMIERMSFEDEEVVEEEAPKKVTSKPTRMKSVPATPIRRTAAQKFEAEER